MRRITIRLVLITAAVVAIAAPARAGDDAVPTAYQSSYDLEAAGKYREALAALDPVAASEGTSYVYRLRRGWLHYLTGDHRTAIAEYGRAIDLAPRALEPRLGLMLPQMALRLWKDAASTGRWILARDPHNYLGRSRLAFISYNLGRYDDAVELYRAVLADYPSDVEMRAGLGWSLLRGGDIAGGAGELRQVLRVAPRHASAQAGIVEIDAAQQRPR